MRKVLAAIAVLLALSCVAHADDVLRVQRDPYGKLSLQGGPAIGSWTPDGGLQSFSASVTSYNWVTPPTSITDFDRFDVGGFPQNSEFGSGTVAVVQARVGTVKVGAGSTVFQSHGSAGYCLQGSAVGSLGGCVGIFGMVTFNINGAGSGNALNGVATNSAKQTNGALSGFNFGNIVGVEPDLNINSLPDGTAPAGNAYGALIGGGSTIQPLGDFKALRIGAAGAAVAWKQAIITDNGASPIGLSLGSVNTSSSSGSQPIVLNSTNAGANVATSIQANATGAIVITVAPGQAFVVTDGTTNLLQGNAAGITLPGAVNAGSIATTGNVSGTYMKLTPVTYATLVAQRPCNSGNQGLLAYITDSPTTTYNAAVSPGGGSNPIGVQCNGTSWTAH